MCGASEVQEDVGVLARLAARRAPACRLARGALPTAAPSCGTDGHRAAGRALPARRLAPCPDRRALPGRRGLAARGLPPRRLARRGLPTAASSGCTYGARATGALAAARRLAARAGRAGARRRALPPGCLPAGTFAARALPPRA